MCTKIFSSQQRVSHGHGPDTEEHTPSTGWMMTMRSICHKAGHWSENSEVLNSESGFLPSHPILRKCHCFSELLVFSTLTHRGVSGAEVFNSVLGFSEIETPMVLSINITEDKT